MVHLGIETLIVCVFSWVHLSSLHYTKLYPCLYCESLSLNLVYWLSCTNVLVQWSTEAPWKSCNSSTVSFSAVSWIHVFQYMLAWFKPPSLAKQHSVMANSHSIADDWIEDVHLGTKAIRCVQGKEKGAMKLLNKGFRSGNDCFEVNIHVFVNVYVLYMNSEVLWTMQFWFGQKPANLFWER